MTDKFADQAALDSAIAARPAAKVTPEQVKATIRKTEYFVLTDTLTVCVLTLVNGYTVTGQSACASPANFDKDIGEALSHKDAENKVWGLEAYLLKQRTFEDGVLRDGFSSGPKLDGMTMHAGTKALLAKPMTRGDYCAYRGWKVPDDENPADNGRIVQYSDGYISWTPLQQFNDAYHSI